MRGASCSSVIPPYVDGLTQTFYNGLCKALSLHQRCGSSQRAIELEVRLGAITPRRPHTGLPTSSSSSSSSLLRAHQPLEPLTPTVLLASDPGAYRFGTVLHSQVVSRVEARIHSVAQLYAEQSRHRRHCGAAAIGAGFRGGLASPPQEQVVVNTLAGTRLLYERQHAASAPLQTGMTHTPYTLCAVQRKQPLDAADVRCRDWLADMRLAISCEDTVSDDIVTQARASPVPVHEAEDATALAALPLDRVVARLRRCLEVSPYLALHVVQQELLFSTQHGQPCPFTCGEQLTPAPPSWSQLQTSGHTRVEIEVDLPKVYQDWRRLVGSKSARAVLERYVDPQLVQILDGQTKRVARSSADAEAGSERQATVPMDPFLRSIVDEMLGLAQLISRP